MASTSKSATALADLQYIQSLLQKAKANQKGTINNTPNGKTPEKINGTTTNMTSSDPTASIGHNVASNKSEDGASDANANDGPSLRTSAVTGSSTSTRGPIQRTPSSISDELVDDGVEPPTIDDHYNYNSHVRNTSPRDRKAILDALREKKKIAQLSLQEVENSKTNTKINLKSVTPTKNDDSNKNNDSISKSVTDTPKSLQCKPSSMFRNTKTFSRDMKSENEIIQHSSNHENESPLPNSSAETADAKSRPTAAKFFTHAPATNEVQNNISIAKMFKLSDTQRSEIGKIFGKMREKLLSNTERSSGNTKDFPANTEKLPVKTEKLPVKTEKLPVEMEKLPVETEKLPVETEKLPVETEKLPVKTEKLPVETEKLPVKTDISQAIADKFPGISEISPVNTDELPTNATNLLPKSDVNGSDGTKPSDLDDVSSEASICGDDATPTNRLDDVSSDGEISSVGEIEEGEITQDDDMSLRIPDQWAHPEKVDASQRLRVLVVGDSRARDMVTANGSLFTSAVCYVDNTYDILNFCNKINDMLKQDDQFDVVLIFVYHMNLIFDDKVNVAGNDVELLQVRKNISISHLFKVVNVHDKKWSKQYPNTNFIWATPYPMDFIACNETRLSAVSRDWAKTLMKTERGSKANQNYWSCIKDISKNWSMVMNHVKRFPLHVPMLVRSSDRNNFRGDGSGCLPPGYLIDGVRPTEHFRQLFATMFVLYLSETCPSLGVRAMADTVPFGAIATEVSAWLAESAATQPNLFSNRGECNDASEIVHTTLRTHRELYTLYNDKPSQHPEYLRQKQMYSWQISGVKNDEPENSWRMHWTNYIQEDFDRTWSLKREELLGKTVSGKGITSSRRAEDGSKILIISDSDNSDERKTERKHSRSRSKSKNSDRSRHRKSRHRSKKSNRDHHKKKKKRRRRTVSSSDLSSEDEAPSCKRRNIFDEDEDDVDIDDLIHKERVNIAKKKQKKTAELKSKKKGNFSKPIGKSESTFPLTESNVISDGSVISLCNSKEHDSLSVQDVASCGGLSSTRNDGNDVASAITVSSEFTSEQPKENSLMADDVKDDIEDELSEVCRIGDNHVEVPSSDEEIADFEMDLDIDEKMDELLDDPDFMKDLEKFGDDLESIIDKDQLNNDYCSQENKENKGEGITLTGSKDILATSTPGSSVCEEEKNTLPDPKIVVERKGNYMVEVLKILNNVSNHFGPLSGSISNMHHKSLECLENAQDPITLLTKNNCAILEVIYSKLKRFIEDPCTPQVHRALYNIAARELRQLLDNPQPDTDMFLGVNIANIAKATLGSDTARIITFIKNTLMYHGLGEVPKDDVMRIFMAVKSVQLKLLENEERLPQS